MASLAASLVAEVSGTLMLLIVSTPVSLAVFTASLVVALLMLVIASSASFCAWPTNVDFSSAVKLVSLIAVFLADNAVLIALMASSLVAEVAGTLTLLIAFSPLVCAVVTSVSLVAASILSLAVLTSPATVFFKASFSSAVKFEASIASSLVLAA